MKKVIMTIVISVLMVGCQMTKSSQLTTSELYGKYNLIAFDEEKIVTSEAPMSIAFEQGVDDQLKVHGVLCNTFIGQAALNNGQLMSEGLASTRMACFREKEAAMENALGSMFKSGVTVKLKGKQLILEGNGHAFVYEKQ